jgi:hypothetical protein
VDFEPFSFAHHITVPKIAAAASAVSVTDMVKLDVWLDSIEVPPSDSLPVTSY